MDSASIDDLAARTTIDEYGDIRFVMARQPQLQSAVLTPAFGGQYGHNPGLFDTFTIRADRSFPQSKVQAQ